MAKFCKTFFFLKSFHCLHTLKKFAEIIIVSGLAKIISFGACRYYLLKKNITINQIQFIFHKQMQPSNYYVSGPVRVLHMYSIVMYIIRVC